MNLFILDKDPMVAASYYCDKHVCKIILEACQMMGIAHWIHNPSILPNNVRKFRWIKNKTYQYHPVSRWVRRSKENYRWTADHAKELFNQYYIRYGKIHSWDEYINWFSYNIPDVPSIGLTEFQQSVAHDCYHKNAVEAYRLYYIRHKSFARWWHSNIPEWYQCGT